MTLPKLNDLFADKDNRITELEAENKELKEQLHKWRHGYNSISYALKDARIEELTPCS